MSGLTASPRPERPGTPGVRWEAVLRPVETVVADDAPDPTPNRAARRAAARAARRPGKPAVRPVEPRAGAAGSQEASEP